MLWVVADTDIVPLYKEIEMHFKLQWEFGPGDWRDASSDMLAGEIWKEHPDEKLQNFMDDWGLDPHTAALYMLIGGEEVSSRRGGRFRLVVIDDA